MITHQVLWEQGTGGGMIQTEELGEFREAKWDAEPEGAARGDREASKPSIDPCCLASLAFIILMMV